MAVSRLVAEMLRRIIDQLTAALQPLKNAVRVDLTGEQIASVFDDPQRLQLVAVPVAEWEPDARRPPYRIAAFRSSHRRQ